MSEAKSTYTYFVYAPDYTDDDAFNRRLAVRAKHLENAKPIAERGILRFGGALVSPETEHSEQKKLIGSGGIYEAESIDQVRKLIEEDIYWTAGVWDKEKLVILPWLPAMPLPVIVKD